MNGELTGELNECDVNANCTNTAGDYECECLDGFEDTSPDTVDFPDRNCTDVDECSIPLGNTTLISGTNYTNECSENAECTNNDGLCLS